jgi:hypothetical protein
MPSTQNKNEHDKYAQDIKTIKDVLIRTEEKSIFETWVFFAYGIILIPGAIANYFIITFLGVPISDVFIKLWIPLIIIMSFLEPVALIRKMSKESLPVFSKTVIKFYLGIFGLLAVMAFLIILAYKSGNLNLLPYFVLCFWALALFFYAQIASPSIFFHAFFLIFAAILLYLADISLEILIIAIALISGVSSIVIGITEYIKAKKYNKTNEE